MNFKQIVLTVSGLCGLLMATQINAYVTVESRTGEPLLGVDRQDSNSTNKEIAATRHALTQMDTLEREVSELRGQVELQDHEIKQLKKSNQELYLDLERRINQIQASKVKETVNIKSEISVPKSPPLPLSTPKTKDMSRPDSKSIPKPTLSLSGMNEQDAYETAYSLVRSKRYPEAITAFLDYLKCFSTGKHAANAHYWLGEIYMVQWNAAKTNQALLDKASQEFTSITNQFPKHPKAVDALLKLGLIELDRGNQAQAKSYLEDVKLRFPNTAAAHIAKTRLQNLD